MSSKKENSKRPQENSEGHQEARPEPRDQNLESKNKTNDQDPQSSDSRLKKPVEESFPSASQLH